MLELGRNCKLSPCRYDKYWIRWSTANFLVCPSDWSVSDNSLNDSAPYLEGGKQITRLWTPYACCRCKCGICELLFPVKHLISPKRRNAIGWRMATVYWMIDVDIWLAVGNSDHWFGGEGKKKLPQCLCTGSGGGRLPVFLDYSWMCR